MAWAFLVSAIVLEVVATVSLRMSVSGSRLWYLPVVVGYLLSFMALAATLSHGMELGVAYGIWSATGVAVTAVISRVLFKEALTFMMTCGIVLIMGGVLFIEMGSV
ncbi:MAG TPA: QacE family quaternary ammonium compound efflux SMR transporter [Candidatus Corynebacterium avicola]|uniref:QacE family quaternary ammonium compound efflux SMR transporter n=1 Tax=Candidatus Corynebacterium avicola TaxID=2838527 RepID=A0A9D1UKJ5_9CORY|nr:QacE family quaternary ammonium compound efflux SMR transporter [Candidatus Corynebacterium avicola]